MDNAEPAELLGMMWQLTIDTWAFKGEENVAQSRLQRNVTNLIRNKKATGRTRDLADIEELEKILTRTKK